MTPTREPQDSREPSRPGKPSGPRKPPESDWERRKRLAEVFGDVLPESTRDDRDSDEPTPAGGGRSGEGVGDRWLRDQVPPHHGS